MTKKRSGKLLNALVIAATILMALVGAFALYVNDYYHADDEAIAIVADENGASDGVTVRNLSGKAIAFVPENPTSGLIFYPGGKVQPEAYAPLLEKCAERGILCVLVKPLFNLAILDTNVADGIQSQFPEIDSWYIGGHSLCGVVAGNYASHHTAEFDGIVFLASYPDVDLSGFKGKSLSVWGDQDHVLKWDDYENAKAKLPSASSELGIPGGNHSHFGNYGEHAGDGAASISREDQQQQAVDAIEALEKAA